MLINQPAGRGSAALTCLSCLCFCLCSRIRFSNVLECSRIMQIPLIILGADRIAEPSMSHSNYRLALRARGGAPLPAARPGGAVLTVRPMAAMGAAGALKARAFKLPARRASESSCAGNASSWTALSMALGCPSRAAGCPGSESISESSPSRLRLPAARFRPARGSDATVGRASRTAAATRTPAGSESSSRAAVPT